MCLTSAFLLLESLQTVIWALTFPNVKINYFISRSELNFGN
jgi:hypothetical protein